MGHQTYYCAICAGPGSSRYARSGIGSSAPKALEWRRSRVARKRQKMLKTGIYPSIHRADDDDEDDDDETVQDGGWTKSEEVETYDPDLVSKESMEWVDRIHCLGLNERSGEGFISGPGSEYDDLGSVQVPTREDPDQPDWTTIFGTYIVEDAVLPFHWPCFNILLLALGEGNFPGNINKITLYDTMMSHGPGSVLERLDYGTIEGPHQDWITIPGEEYSVTNPIAEDTTKFLHELLARDIFKQPSSDSSTQIQNRVVHDPFAKIPFDVVYVLLSRLPTDSVLALSKASWFVNIATRYNGFWKRLITQEMKWCWELCSLLDEEKDKKGKKSKGSDEYAGKQKEGRNAVNCGDGHEEDNDAPLSDTFELPPDLSLKLFYLYLDNKTTPTYGMDAKFMSLGNRRRIWKPCQQIADEYYKLLAMENDQGESR
ncbi:hypothetical protein FQN50_003289 [Emmonsiellopsis sp. PD_5]|nr:hypothetical protein FQN50_003289 [Emmonsiellopsis sp. PD_5]